MLSFLFIFILSISFSTIIIYTVFTVWFRKGIQTHNSAAGVLPMVSILKPLRNSDDDIEKNLESFFQLDYPQYEILFGVDSLNDSIGFVLQTLMAKYAKVSAKVISTGHSTTENPKIHKLSILERYCNGILYWVSDSNIRVARETLKRLVNEYTARGAKIVFSPIRATGSRSVGSIIENTYINHFLSGNMISAWKLFKKQIIVGKSILIEKMTLNRFGGFSYFKDYLAEDYMMGVAYTQSKFPISSNFVWVTNINQTTTILGFFSRMERWAKLRYYLNRPFYLLEILLNPIMIAVFAVLFFKEFGFYFLLFIIGLKICFEFINFLFLNVEDRKKPCIVVLLPFCIVLKDLLLFLIYFIPFFSSTVKWRGGKIHIGKDTLIASKHENLLLNGA